MQLNYSVVSSAFVGFLAVGLGAAFASGNAYAAEPTKPMEVSRSQGYLCIEVDDGVYYCCAEGGRICWLRDTGTQAFIPKNEHRMDIAPRKLVVRAA